MAIKTVLYRGTLKSCNYLCSYCTFSKQPISKKELIKDQQQFEKFCDSIQKRARIQGIEAIMVVPYGEALIHSYYWEGLAHLSQLQSIYAIGSQTNLSFSIGRYLKVFEKAGGHREKLRLWVTFHPEMVSLPEFLKQCKKLKKEGINFSVGTVAIPKNLDLIKELRRELPKDIYLWLNRMNQLNRPYTMEEITIFKNIDPFFIQELETKKADKNQCYNRLFVEGDGKLHLCNMSAPLSKNWYELEDDFPLPVCDNNECSCYLAYAGREDYEHSCYFGQYPLFRVLWKPKAIFFDIDNTLLSYSKVNSSVIPWLKNQKQHAPLFLATSLPYKEAERRYQTFLHLFDGGIYAGGAHIYLKSKGRRKLKENFSPLDTSIIPLLKEKQAEHGYWLRIYENDDITYKITLEKPYRHTWRDKEKELLEQFIPSTNYRCFQQENYLHIVSAKADNGNGMKILCEWLGISTKDCVAAGNSMEALPMLKLCGYAIAAPDSSVEVQSAATQAGFQASVPWNDM